MFGYPKEKMINCRKCGKPTKVIIMNRVADIQQIYSNLCDKCQMDSTEQYNKILSRLEKEYKNHRISCKNCGGSGKIKGYTCVECGGKGKIKDPYLRLDLKASDELHKKGW